MIRTILWADDAVVLIDQKPFREGALPDPDGLARRHHAIKDSPSAAPPPSSCAAMGIALARSSYPRQPRAGSAVLRGSLQGLREGAPHGAQPLLAIERMQRLFARSSPQGSPR